MGNYYPQGSFFNILLTAPAFQRRNKFVERKMGKHQFAKIQ